MNGHDVWEHICMVCFRYMTDHVDDEVWPPRCCYGCGCGEEMPNPDESAPKEVPAE